MLVGLAGAAGAGKDTVAGYLCGSHGFVQAKFADPLYAIVSHLTGISALKFADRSVKEQTIEWLGKSPRELLQLLGTEFGREMLDEDIWVRWLMRRLDPAEDCVVTDVRFDNEARAIRDRGGVVWRILRPAHSCLSPDAARHSSEAGISDSLIDADILNDGSLEHLQARIVAAMKTLAVK